MSDMFFSKIIDDQKKWKIKEILKKKIRKDTVFYQIKWIDYSDKYIEWVEKKIWRMLWSFDRNSMSQRKRSENEQRDNRWN